MQVFISYKREDRFFAESLRTKIRSWQYDVWMDVHDIAHDENWDNAIERGLAESDIVLGILSPRSVKSENVKNEWTWAQAHKKPLVLVMMATATLPLSFIRLNYIDFRRGKRTEGYVTLKTTLEKKSAELSNLLQRAGKTSLERESTALRLELLLIFSRIHDLQVNTLLWYLIHKRDLPPLERPLRLMITSLRDTLLRSRQRRYFNISIMRPLPDGTFDLLVTIYAPKSERLDAMRGKLSWKNPVSGVAGTAIATDSIVFCADLSDESQAKAAGWAALEDQQKPRGTIMCIPVRTPLFDAASADELKHIAVVSITAFQKHAIDRDQLEVLRTTVAEKIAHILQIYRLAGLF